MTLSDLENKFILVVDDDKMLLDELEKMLKKSGYNPLTARSAGEAMATLEQVGHDVVSLAILDVVMPGTSGLELAKHLGENTTVPFMFFSGHDDAEIIKQAAQYGALGYLPKTYDVIQILPTIEAGIARAEDIRRLKESEANLTAALNASRETNIAMGAMMERHQIDRQMAFEILREHARSHRVKIHDVAVGLLSSMQALGAKNVLELKRAAVLAELKALKVGTE